VVAPRELHGVLGENGAGKSTLMKIIYGAVRPDDGELRWDGAVARTGSPAAARQRGTAMVFQHFALFDSLTVVENVWLGVDGRGGGPPARDERWARGADAGSGAAGGCGAHGARGGARARGARAVAGGSPDAGRRACAGGAGADGARG